jgi:hypothetical protein
LRIPYPPFALSRVYLKGATYSRHKNEALYSFLDLAFGAGKRVMVLLVSHAVEPICLTIYDGFIKHTTVEYIWGDKLRPPRRPGTEELGLHLSELLIALCQKGAFKKQKKFLREMRSILWSIHYHFEFAVTAFSLIPLRALVPIRKGGLGRPRNVLDVQIMEEQMQCAHRAGAALTAHRLMAALRSHTDGLAPGSVTLELKAGMGSASSTDAPAPAGSSTVLLGVHAIPVVKPVGSLTPLQSSCAEWRVMFQYMATSRTSWPEGGVHVTCDGVQLHTSGELNQYAFLAPGRPEQGISEVAVWGPVQEYIGMHHAAWKVNLIRRAHACFTAASPMHCRVLRLQPSADPWRYAATGTRQVGALCRDQCHGAAGKTGPAGMA